MVVFLLESIPEELIIFLTQQNNFEIYVYGDVPISQTPEAGKFSFEAASVKSFTVLEKPAFPTLPLLKIYQLQLVDPVLKANGIGGFPTKQLIGIIILAGAVWMLWNYFTAQKVAVIQAQEQTNPYQLFLKSLSKPDPYDEINKLVSNMQLLYTAPGWAFTHIVYANGSIAAAMKSNGGTVQALSAWAKSNRMSVDIKTDGIYVTKGIILANRPEPTKIYPVKELVGSLVDRIATVYPGNRLKLGDFKNRGNFTDVMITIMMDRTSPFVIDLIGKQLRNLPFVLQNVSLDADRSNNLSGSITIEALGS